MATTIDTYIVSIDEGVLRAFVAFFSQVIGPARGRSAVEANPAADPPIEAQPAIGDPAKWYACIRAPFAVAAQKGIEIVPNEEGASVVGVWA